MHNMNRNFSVVGVLIKLFLPFVAKKCLGMVHTLENSR